MIPEQHFASKQEVENLVLSGNQGGYLRLKDVAQVIPAVGPVEIAREDRVNEVIVRGDAAGVSVGQALSELKGAVSKMNMPVGYEVSYGGQAQMMAEMQRAVLLITIARGLKIDCGCGLFFQRQVGLESILEDALLLGVAGWLYWREWPAGDREEGSLALVQPKL